MGFTTKEVSVEAHQYIDLPEQDDAQPRWACEIVSAEYAGEGLGEGSNSMLQIPVEAFNSTARLDGLVPTPLGFGTRSLIHKLNILTSDIMERANTMKSARKGACERYAITTGLRSIKCTHWS
ncbi:hypothetical protein K3495_g8389 [Podosphaera aphanis]|nr:hypothetical protein K3495_g8389 [Podosphaera aphanis]